MYRKSSPSHKQLHFRNQMIGLVVGILVLGIYIAVFGLNSVINFSVWVGNLVSGNKTQTVEKKDDDFFGTIFVDALPPATNSAELAISGSSSNFDTLKFRINGKVVKTTKVLDQDTFSETIGNLKPGENTVMVIAESKKDKKEKESDTFTVLYKNTPPKLELAEPTNESTVNKQETMFKGDTDPGVTVEIDGAPVTVTTSGHFESNVHLKEGDNTIVVLATDNAGNESKQELKIKYQKEE